MSERVFESFIPGERVSDFSEKVENLLVIFIRAAVSLATFFAAKESRTQVSCVQENLCKKGTILFLCKRKVLDIITPPPLSSLFFLFQYLRLARENHG